MSLVKCYWLFKFSYILYTSFLTLYSPGIEFIDENISFSGYYAYLMTRCRKKPSFFEKMSLGYFYVAIWQLWTFKELLGKFKISFNHSSQH